MLRVIFRNAHFHPVIGFRYNFPGVNGVNQFLLADFGINSKANFDAGIKINILVYPILFAVCDMASLVAASCNIPSATRLWIRSCTSPSGSGVYTGISARHPF